VVSAIPESTDAADISVTVKAFMAAELPIELIELLEKFILQLSSFSDTKTLQNILMLTAFLTGHRKVLGFINTLDRYDTKLPRLPIQHGLFEDALTISALQEDGGCSSRR